MNNQGAGDRAIAMAFLAIVLISVIVGLIVQIFYLLTLSKCLSRVHPNNRDMEPGMVWLNLVPCLNLVWIFMTVSKVGSSLRKEYRDRALYSDNESFGTNLGITYNILFLLGMIPYIGALFSLGGLVCFIIYWVQIAGFSARIAEPYSESDRRYADDDFDEDLPRPRKRRNDEHDRYQREDDGEPDDRYRA